MINNTEFLKNKAAEYGIELSSSQLEKFSKFYEILKEYNENVNLIANTDIKIVYEKHFSDSLALGKILQKQNFSKNTQIKLIDIGTGGGFPAIPLSIAFPDWKIVALDSIGKKIDFIKHIANKLDLNITPLVGRSEDIAKDNKYRGQFHICTTRAVAKLPVIAEYCIPFVIQDGVFVSYKAKNVQEELDTAKKAITTLGGKVDEIVEYQASSPDSEQEERNLVVIKKIKNTPPMYPRKAGIPKKTPL